MQAQRLSVLWSSTSQLKHVAQGLCSCFGGAWDKRMAPSPENLSVYANVSFCSSSSLFFLGNAWVWAPDSFCSLDSSALFPSTAIPLACPVQGDYSKHVSGHESSPVIKACSSSFSSSASCLQAAYIQGLGGQPPGSTPWCMRKEQEACSSITLCLTASPV